MSAYKKLVEDIVTAEQRLQDAREITQKARAAEERAEKDVGIAYDALSTFHEGKLASAREKAGVEAKAVAGWFV